MARRASLFDSLRTNEDHTTLILGGGYDFMPPSNEVPPLPVLTALDRSYDLLDYDLFRMTPRERVFLVRAGLEVNEEWVASRDMRLDIFERDGKTIGVLLYPMLDQGVTEASAEIMQMVADAVAEHRDKVDLLIGLSPWGYMSEKAYYDAGLQAPDIVFGTGPGPGIRGTSANHPASYWVRPYALGKALNQLDILALPVRDEGFAWEETVNIRSIVISLDETYQERPDIKAIIDQAQE